MAASELEILIAKLVYQIAYNSNGYTYVLGFYLSSGTIVGTM